MKEILRVLWKELIMLWYVERTRHYNKLWDNDEITMSKEAHNLYTHNSKSSEILGSLKRFIMKIPTALTKYWVLSDDLIFN